MCSRHPRVVVRKIPDVIRAKEREPTLDAEVPNIGDAAVVESSVWNQVKRISLRIELRDGKAHLRSVVLVKRSLCKRIYRLFRAVDAKRKLIDLRRAEGVQESGYSPGTMNLIANRQLRPGICLS